MRHLATITILVSISIGCAPEDVRSGDRTVGVDEGQQADDSDAVMRFEVAERTSLPVFSGSGECLARSPAGDAEIWLAASDAMVIGRLVDVEAVLFPAASSKGFRTLVSSCSLLNPAIDLVFEVLHSFRGGVSGTIRVRLGSGILSAYGIGSQWDGSSLLVSRSPFEVGHLYGLPLRYFAHEDVYTPLLEPLFGFNTNGTSFFFSPNRCGVQPPAIRDVAALASVQPAAPTDPLVTQRRGSVFSDYDLDGPVVERALYGMCYD